MLNLAIESVAVFGLVWSVFMIVVVMPSKSRVAIEFAVEPPDFEVLDDSDFIAHLWDQSVFSGDPVIDSLDFEDSDPEPVRTAPKMITAEPVIRVELPDLYDGKTRKELIAMVADLGVTMHPKSPRKRVLAKLHELQGRMI